MLLRRFRDGDGPALWRLFHGTVREVCSRDYSELQVKAWAPDDIDVPDFVRKLASLAPFVVEVDGEIAGYADVQSDGYIDHFYCHRNWQGKGVGSLLMKAIEDQAERSGLERLCSDVSITARPFFEGKGFVVVKEQDVLRRGVMLRNYRMEKLLRA